MSSSKFTVTKLKKNFEHYDKSSLIAEIAELYKRFPEVKKYYQIKKDPKSEVEIVNDYKKKIEAEFFPKRGYGQGRVSVAKKSITAYRVHLKSLAQCEKMGRVL